MEQVRFYCMEVGCEFACITNGNVWIFFKVFEKSKNWKDLKAFVVTNLKYFQQQYTEAINIFGFTSVVEGSLKVLLGSGSRQNREIFYPKEHIKNYNEKVDQNNFANELRPIAEKYFGVIEVEDIDFMEHCYVNQREHEIAFSNFQAIIKDNLSPYFINYGVQDFKDDKKGGKFGKRIQQVIKEKAKGQVLILFGGKGSGKSTFLKRLLYHKTPDYINKHSKIAIVDLIKVAQDRKAISKSVWTQVTEKLDTDNILETDRDSLIKNLFFDQYETAKKQILYGLKEESEVYISKLNELIKNLIRDKKYITKRLVAYWKRKKRGTIIVVDNTDQFSHTLQDYCFSIAQEIADNLGCLVIISMREERFHSSRIHGTLDAYQNSGFHISSPVTQEVFQKRITYVLQKLNEKLNTETTYYGQNEIQKEKGSKRLFEIFDNEFKKGYSSPLCEFISACAHGNIRLALELFRDFVKSGYTNVDEWISVPNFWSIKIHQVLKPFMIPYRFFYDETQSSIPNIFQIRSKENGSHFTSLRILSLLVEGKDPNTPVYVPLSYLKDYFSEHFNMEEDFEINLDILLRRDIIESNNRVDFYSDEVDRLKVTTYGLYIYRILSSYFTYLELVATDCGYFSESVANQIMELSKEELRLYHAYNREDRIKVRLKKAEEFIKYLIEEEEKENDFYNLKAPSNFAIKINDSFIKEKEEVLESAARNVNKFQPHH